MKSAHIRNYSGPYVLAFGLSIYIFFYAVPSLMLDWVLNTPLSQLYVFHALPFWKNFAYSSRLSFSKINRKELKSKLWYTSSWFILHTIFTSNIQLGNNVSQDAWAGCNFTYKIFYYKHFSGSFEKLEDFPEYSFSRCRGC